MKKIVFTILLPLIFIASCSKNLQDHNANNGDNQKPDGLPAPEVTYEGVTATSFTAKWNAIEGAEVYRYEVYYMENGKISAVAAKNIKETSFTLDALRPATEYNVKVVAKQGGKSSPNYYQGTVTTEGDFACQFTITPYETYCKDGYVHPYAKVEVSNPDVYYWVSAIPSVNIDKAADWIKEEIAYLTGRGATWDSLLKEHLILKGNDDSEVFVFNGYDHYYFLAVPVEKDMNGVKLCGEVTRSHRFWSESIESSMMHESEFKDFAGDWSTTTGGTIFDNGEKLEINTKAEMFPVHINVSSDNKSFNLTGWGGSRNRFANYPIELMFNQANDGYNSLSIYFPQTIKTEGNIEWNYVYWYNFTGTVDGVEVNKYLPYDKEINAQLPEWSMGFFGYMANLNRTVIKIFNKSYRDMNDEGAYVIGMWPYGSDLSGDNSKNKLLNDKYEEPVGFYYLVRQDVVDGLDLKLPDTEVAASVARSAGFMNSSEQYKHAESHIEAYRRL